VDGQSIERFAAQAERYLQELQDSLEDGSYRPHPVKRVEIPKGDGRTRPLGIPTVKDRIVQTALKMVISSILAVSNARRRASQSRSRPRATSRLSGSTAR